MRCKVDDPERPKSPLDNEASTGIKTLFDEHVGSTQNSLDGIGFRAGPFQPGDSLKCLGVAGLHFLAGGRYR